MPRPTTKNDLLSSSNEKFKAIWDLIDSIPKEQQNAAFQFGDSSSRKEAHWKRDKNLRDVLIHLYEWHRLLIDWISANQNGENKSFLPEAYNWRTYGQMNVMFWEQHQTTSYDRAKELLQNSHQEAMRLIEGFTNEELFSKGVFPWAGTSTVGSYCAANTASHYDWALKKIKLHKKTCTAAR